MRPRLISALLLLAACGRPAASRSAVESLHNGVSCAVDYGSLHVDRLGGLTVYDSGIAEAEKIRHLNELNAMPDGFLRVYRDYRLPIKLARDRITDFDEMKGLADQVPRGWESTGYTWKDVPGTFYGGALLLGPSDHPNNAWSLAVHEGTHGYDLTLGVTTTDAGFTAVFNAARAAPGDPNGIYRLSNIEEFLAVGVDELNCNDQTRADVAAWYPDFVQYMHTAYQGIFVL